MKRFYFFIGLVLCMWGCNKSTVIEEGEKVVVSIGFDGEISMTDTPLVRAEGSNDLYAINIFYDKEKDGWTDDKYAIGLFDNTNDMVISLLTGYKYRFECAYVPNGKDYNGYYLPGEGAKGIFLPNDYHGSLGVLNTFVTHLGVFNLYYGQAGGYYGIANADRYFGVLDGFSPKAGERVVIDMKRCVFGLKILVSGLSEGRLSLGKCFGGDAITVEQDGIARDEIRAFKSVYECWQSFQDYSVTESMSLNWIRDNGVNQDLGSQEITVKRNTLTTVNINLVSSSSDSSLGLNLESNEMGNSTVNININADGTVDTNVDPQH